MPFSNLGLVPVLVETLTACGYKVPTPIQLQVIPVVLKRVDLIAIAPTGTGKTAAFTLPLLQNLGFKSKNPDTAVARESVFRMPKALILTPTRELAIQVYESVLTYGQNLEVDVVNLFGGVSYDAQIEKLKSGVDIVVATPGRLRDLLERRAVELSNLRILVLDEADRMLDMGFIEDVEIIINQTPKARQTLLFSATFSDEVRALAKTFLNKAESVHTSPQAKIAPKVTHVIHPVDPGKKIALLVHLIEQPPKRQILIFTRTKIKADEVAKALTARGFMCMATHSGRTQAYRTKAMACFKDGRIAVLVATDIAARGLDIEDLGLVINFEIPNLPEDYVHRIGRTGRAGLEGRAISLVTQAELYLLSPIEQLIKANIPQIWVEGFAPLHFDPRKMTKKSLQSTKREHSKNSETKTKTRKAKGRPWE
jgi:ATP-dependent RNA helicase RhlE